jgi:hypothetical protein
MLNDMAIQFHCPSCGQPIEVDDEWASKAVACPYCRKTVSAPETSTLDPAAAVTTASPVAPAMDEAPGLEGPWSPSSRPPAAPRNPFAVWSLLLTLTAVVVYLTVNIVMAVYAINRVGIRSDPQEFQKAIVEEMEKGEHSSTMVVVGLVGMVALLCWLAGLALAIVALLKSRARRGMAVASLVIGGAMFLLMCFGMLVQFAG